MGGIILRELVRSDLEYHFDSDALLKRLHCTAEDEPFTRAMEIVPNSVKFMRPAYAVREFAVDGIEKNGVKIGGCFFNSKITAEKLKDQKTVFVYIATCGKKVNDIIEKTEDVLDKYILDQAAYLAYLQAMNQMSAHIEEAFGIKRQIRLCPGSIIDWSIIDVKKIFTLMDGLYQQLDVEVLQSGLIDPLKSTSGLFYSSEDEFESCAVCPRANCENRTMPFNEELHEKMVNL